MLSSALQAHKTELHLGHVYNDCADPHQVRPPTLHSEHELLAQLNSSSRREYNKKDILKL